ncbi:MAG: hypothetical protein JNK10_01125 [Cyclobacteriaceae bacterium]|nr:hypothetical protein [Cyclobacteriaceae bacterium]
MKTTLILIFMIISATAFSQTATTVPTSTDTLFIVTYTTGPSWDLSKKPGEQLHFKEHSANLGAWRKQGLIKFGARYADKGIIFLSAASSAAARELILGDPAVSTKLFNADIQKLNPFYFGCIEKNP